MVDYASSIVIALLGLLEDFAGELLAAGVRGEMFVVGAVRPLTQVSKVP